MSSRYNSTYTSEKSRKTNSGIFISGGKIEQSDFDDIDYRELMQDYTNMRNDDSIASSSIDILLFPILNSKYKIMPGYLEGEKPSDISIEAAEYVADIIYNLRCGLKYYQRHKLLALYYGFAIFEKVWEKGTTSKNNKITNLLVDMYPIQHDTIYQWKYDEKANFIGIKQEQRIPEKGYKHIDIESQYLHVYTPFEEFKNIQGRSLLRPSRLVWKIKKQVWLSSGRASTRGAGIPEFKITPTGNEKIDATTKSTIETIARNVGNSENAYVITQKDAVEFTLHTLQNQEMNLQLIQQANTEMFYNTLSEFVTSGIGGNGSRAATSEHKSPYFDALDTIVQTYQDNEDVLIREIIDNSYYYGKLKEWEYPYCVLERAKDTDVLSVGALLNSLIASKTITNTPDLEIYIRNMLGLPEKTEEEIEQYKEEKKQEYIENQIPMQEDSNGVQSTEETKDTKDTEETEVEEENNIKNKDENIKEEGKELKHDHIHQLSEEIEDEIFELQSALININTAEIKSETIINDIFEKLIEDIANKLNRDQKTEIKLPYKKEFYDRLASVYNNVYKNGQMDIRKEYAKIAGTQLAKLEPIKVEGDNEKLRVKIDTLYDALESSIKNDLLLVNKNNIENNGGMKNYIIDRFSDTQKKLKAELKSISSGGYISGRNDQLTELETIDPELKRLYMNKLEAYERVCEVCRPLNFMTMSRDEAEYVGLNFDGSPVNPLCLGGVNCKCTWRPAYDLPGYQASKKKEHYELESEGQWITINGNHILVDEGSIAEEGVSKIKQESAIRKYTGIYYGSIKSNKMKEEHDAIETFITKSKKHEGDIFRGIEVEESIINNLKEAKEKGNKISMQGISSWTKDKEIAKDYAVRKGNKGVVFVVKGSKQSVDVEDLSEHKYEKETIVSEKQKYKIKDIKTIKDKNSSRGIEITEIELEEV